MYVLITGSCGLVGSECATFFIKKGYKIIGIDNDMRRYFFGKEASTKWMKEKLLKNHRNSYLHKSIDIRKYTHLKKIFKLYGNNIKLIVHCAAQPSHDWAAREIKTDFDVNTCATLNMLELTKKYCNKKTPFIFLSTNKVYGDNPNKLKIIKHKSRFILSKKEKFANGIDESMSLDNCVHSFFGVSKLSADLMVQEFGKNFNMNTVCFRAGCITGPNHSGAELHGFLSFLIKSCVSKQYYQIIGHKGFQVRDNIHSADLAEAFWCFFKKPFNDAVFNIGGSIYSNCSILEAIQYIENKKNIKVKKTILKVPRAGDHQWYISDIRKFQNIYPSFKLKYNTQKILDEIIDLY